MTSNPTSHPWLEHAAPYALGALDESDRVSFEAHLASCDVCATEVRELRDVTGVIAGGGGGGDPAVVAAWADIC